VVAQNSAETRLFHNVRARPGLRVRLSGNVDNPRGIGAVLRLKAGARFGPAREIHAGSGYWSQDSVTQVMTRSEPPTQLWIRWPDRRAITVDIPAGAREIVVGIDGAMKRLR
jgi:hypothetical protein